MGKGYMGKILTVDLDTATWTEEQVSDEIYEQYLAGQGLGAYILYNRIPAGADPLGPENLLGFMAGLLTGTGSLFSGRWTVVGKSPLTGGWGDANCGGQFAPAIKRSGYDGIFFKGISAKPVYLLIDHDKIELKDATGLWGKDAVETEEILMEEHGTDARVATIGPSGENLSLISGICNDRGRIAARSGLGAVMGSKKLKAVVLKGCMRIGTDNDYEIKRISQKCNRWVQFDLPKWPGFLNAYMGTGIGLLPTQMAIDGFLYKVLNRMWGTSSMNQMSVGMGDSPIKNWKGSNADWGIAKSKTVNSDVFTKCETVKYHCYSCPLGCGGICSISGKYSETHKPEYETVLALGGLIMNEDADSIFYLNEVLNRAGMDTISAGGTVAYAIECFEKGILTREDTGGLELTWGNTEAIVALIEKMVKREGIGDILADGSKAAAKKIGKGSIDYAIQAGGQEPAMHDGRGDPGFGLHYSVEPTPGRHTIGSQLYYEMFQLWKAVKGLPKIKPLYMKDEKYAVDEGKIQQAAACSKYMNIVNACGMCLFGVFLGIKRIPTFDWINAATGWDKSPNDYMDIGERIQTIKQAFNVKHGIDPREYKLSDRALGLPPLTEGANKGRSVPIDKLRHDYWAHFDWDPQTGKPTTTALKRLGIHS